MRAGLGEGCSGSGSVSVSVLFLFCFNGTLPKNHAWKSGQTPDKGTSPWSRGREMPVSRAIGQEHAFPRGLSCSSNWVLSRRNLPPTGRCTMSKIGNTQQVRHPRTWPQLFKHNDCVHAAWAMRAASNDTKFVLQTQTKQLICTSPRGIHLDEGLVSP